jgi:C1A family cysteine protease
MKKIQRKLGWLHELPDYRDITYKGVVKKLPKSVDLTEGQSPIKDQGTLGSCTANSLAGILEYNEPKDSPLVELSRLFIYYIEREYEGTIKSDAGAMIRDGIKMLAKFGVCPEDMWPYIIEKFADKPLKKCYKEALKRKITSYATMDSLQEFKQCLADGRPFSFGFTVYESFMNGDVAKTGILQMPEPGEGVMGGHAVIGVGYDDEKQVIKVRNSWGKGWGDKGFFYMPFAYTEKSLSDDYWTIIS